MFEYFKQLTIWLCSFHPTRGGKQITNESTHKPAMSDFARFVDIILGYVTGLVTATYRSNEIAHRFNIDAVHLIKA
jgi:hypothetical protein